MNKNVVSTQHTTVADVMLKEEVRVRRVHSNENHRERVMLRRQEATITRDPVDSSAVPTSLTNGAIKKDKNT